MIAEPVDPRDVRQDVDHPVYRVYFWHQPDPAWGAHSWEWRIRDARDVFEVIGWAEAERGERTYQLFVEELMEEGNAAEGVRLVRLAGDDPTRAGEGVNITFTRE
ncbi:hypothetical protein N1031_00050 [Herbiconiux moechotypicola]|uniref:Uncharacterized protein n=1 Tax=Herbiconiux moechotypicola TaxID=637393 RepID=A0ABN3D921_9MICO|nr:hypothetical protein [Herbiconiux moechotypicola]MCS5728141.1 hypothetical protein [Herbiconiux moechotypicola]